MADHIEIVVGYVAPVTYRRARGRVDRTDLVRGEARVRIARRDPAEAPVAMMARVDGLVEERRLLDGRLVAPAHWTRGRDRRAVRAGEVDGTVVPAEGAGFLFGEEDFPGGVFRGPDLARALDRLPGDVVRILADGRDAAEAGLADAASRFCVMAGVVHRPEREPSFRVGYVPRRDLLSFAHAGHGGAMRGFDFRIDRAGARDAFLDGAAALGFSVSRRAEAELVLLRGEFPRLREDRNNAGHALASAVAACGQAVEHLTSEALRLVADAVDLRAAISAGAAAPHEAEPLLARLGDAVPGDGGAGVMRDVAALGRLALSLSLPAAAPPDMAEDDAAAMVGLRP